MRTLQIPEKNILVDNIPESWDEMSIEHKIYAGDLLYAIDAGEIDILLFKKLMVDRFIGRENNKNKSRKFRNNYDYWAAEYFLLQLADFFFKPINNKNQPGLEIALDFYEHPVPELNINGVIYNAPAPAMISCTFGQFKNAMAHSRRYANDKNGKHIKQMTAELFASEDKHPPAESISNSLAYLTLLYINGCINYYKNEGQIEVDGEYHSFGFIFKSQDSSQDNNSGQEGIGLTGILYGISETGVFGHGADLVSQQNIVDVFMEIKKKYLENKKMKAKLK